MPIIPLAQPYTMSSATFTVVADDFTAAVSQVQLDPSVSASTFRGIGGTVRRGQGRAEWACALGLAQDLDPAGLLRYLLEHDGEIKSCTLVPTDGGPTVAVDLIIAPATIGGTAAADGSLAQSTTTLAVDGAPVFIDAP